MMRSDAKAVLYKCYTLLQKLPFMECFFIIRCITWEKVNFFTASFDAKVRHGKPAAGFLELMSQITFYYWVCDLFLNFIFSYERQGGRSNRLGVP